MKETRLKLLSAGAAEGIIERIKNRIQSSISVELDVSFGPVGLNSEKLVNGMECDAIITSHSEAKRLLDAGYIERHFASLGEVETALAVRSDNIAPDVSNERKLADVLTTASRIYCIDPVTATGGRHFSKIIDRLDVRDSVASRLQIEPNGASAMRALAGDHSHSRAIGCAQMTEITDTEGVYGIGSLPEDLRLVTSYTVHVASGSKNKLKALDLVDNLTSSEYSVEKTSSGFIPR